MQLVPGADRVVHHICIRCTRIRFKLDALLRVHRQSLHLEAPAIMQFERFHWLSHHSIWAILPWSTKIASAWFFWAFLFLLKSSFLYFGAFFNRTRRLAACTQAVIILRSTNYIAIQLKCSAFEVVRNSIESMCLSYSAFDCISWNRLIACYSFTDLRSDLL